MTMALTERDIEIVKLAAKEAAQEVLAEAREVDRVLTPPGAGQQRGACDLAGRGMNDDRS